MLGRSERRLPRRRSPKGEGGPRSHVRRVLCDLCVFLKSLKHLEHYCDGVTGDLRSRL
jgi:hypothetical protein